MYFCFFFSPVSVLFVVIVIVIVKNDHPHRVYFFILFYNMFCLYLKHFFLSSSSLSFIITSEFITISITVIVIIIIIVVIILLCLSKNHDFGENQFPHYWGGIVDPYLSDLIWWVSGIRLVCLFVFNRFLKKFFIICAFFMC